MQVQAVRDVKCDRCGMVGRPVFSVNFNVVVSQSKESLTCIKPVSVAICSECIEGLGAFVKDLLKDDDYFREEASVVLKGDIREDYLDEIIESLKVCLKDAGVSSESLSGNTPESKDDWKALFETLGHDWIVAFTGFFEADEDGVCNLIEAWQQDQESKKDSEDTETTEAADKVALIERKRQIIDALGGFTVFREALTSGLHETSTIIDGMEIANDELESLLDDDRCEEFLTRLQGIFIGRFLHSLGVEFEAATLLASEYQDAIRSALESETGEDISLEEFRGKLIKALGAFSAEVIDIQIK
ncbi:MAG TPA: hypothetical protein VJJ80_02515 [Patescibacteria group bacterium]|nr:hypothetical protein [Patescibacteria group bacterium]